jgi:hypothetical protein
VLRPGAVFGMIWNVDDCESHLVLGVVPLGLCLTLETDNKPHIWPATTKWEQKLNDFVLKFDDGLPRFRHQVRHLSLTTPNPSSPPKY